MADQLYLNLWFPSFAEHEILPRLQSALSQFPFSVQRPGIAYAAVHPVSWQEPTIFEQTFDYGTDPQNALQMMTDFLHADNAYEVEIFWDLHVPEQEGDLDETWVLRPQSVRFIAFGTAFDDSSHQEDGHIQVDFGLDTPFLHEDMEHSPEVQARIQANVQKLVAFIRDVEKNCGISGRILWSEGESNLAQKLISRFQRVQ